MAFKVSFSSHNYVRKPLKAAVQPFAAPTNVKLTVSPKFSRPLLRKLKVVDESSSNVETKTATKDDEEVSKKVVEGTVEGDSANPPTTDSLEELLNLARAELSKEDADKNVLTDLVTRLEAAGSRVADALASGSRAEGKVKDAIRKCEIMALQMAELTQDFENYKRRSQAGQVRAEAETKGRLVRDLIPLLDNFELARSSLKATTDGESKIHASYQGLYKQLTASLAALGVESVSTVGMPFDPNCHEAVLRAPSNDHPDGTVTKEFRRGFKVGDTLIRPAMVQVSFREDGGASETPKPDA